MTRLSGRLNKEGVEGQSGRPDKPGPVLCWPLFILQTCHRPSVTSLKMSMVESENRHKMMPKIKKKGVKESHRRGLKGGFRVLTNHRL